MKKSLSLFLALLLLFSLAACGKDKVAEAAPKHSESAPEVSGKSGEGSSAPASDLADPTFANLTVKPAEDAAEPVFSPVQPTIKETVLVDEKGVRITAKDLIYSNSMAELVLLIENGSDTDLSFFIDSDLTAVNGVMCDSLWLYCNVPAGGRSTEGVWFENDELACRGITDLASIELGFDIQDENLNYFIEPSPCEILTSLADSFCFPNFPLEDAVSSGLIENVAGCEIITCESGGFFSDGGVSVDTAVILKDRFGELNLYLDGRNDSDKPVELCVRDIYMNGLLVSSGRWSTITVAPEKHGIFYVNLNYVFPPDFYDVYGLETLGSIGFTIETAGTDYYDTIATGKPVTLTLNAEANSFDESGDSAYRSDMVNVVFKCLCEAPSSYINDLNALFLVKNISDEPLYPDTVLGSLTVNGNAVECYCPAGAIPAHTSSAVYVGLVNNAALEPKDVKEMNLTLSFRNSLYDIVDSTDIALLFD